MKPVLIVDDDPMTRKVIRRMLEEEDIPVMEAANGIECLDCCRTASPTVALIDIVMPEKDGLATIREIRRDCEGIRIVAMSGGLVLTPDAYIEAAVEIGADRAIAKPIDKQLLVSMVKTLLDGDR